MLKGQISSLQLFNESLNQSVLSDLFLVGRYNFYVNSIKPYSITKK